MDSNDITYSYYIKLKYFPPLTMPYMVVTMFRTPKTALYCKACNSEAMYLLSDGVKVRINVYIDVYI